MQSELSFGQWLKQRRKALDLTQEELAERVGCASETLRKIEADRRRPSRDIAEHLAQAVTQDPAERIAVIQAARGLPLRDGSPPIVAPTVHGQPSPSRPRTNLPVSPTVLIGRITELGAISHELRLPHVRLLTLTGAGGTGKTRLALEVATQMRDEYPDGIWFVPLAALRDPTLVAGAIVHALGLQERAGEAPLARLKDHIGHKRLLLVLDNFEHVIDASPQIAELLHTTGLAKMLVTSREPLHLYGEQEYPVLPLALPAASLRLGRDALAELPSIMLFLQRAHAVRPDLQLTTDNAAIIADICRRLDGLPLAIELAAARTKVYEPRALLHRLDHRLRLLTGGQRDLPARQQTMHATISWSYDLLSAEQQHLFGRLAVFAGGWTIAAAQAVCAPARSSVVADDLEALLDKSLLVRAAGADGEPRFALLETIREYAWEAAERGGTLVELRQQHTAYYRAVAEEAAAELAAPREAAALDRLEREHDNLRAALLWTLEHNEREEVLRIAVALSEFWIIRGHRLEGRTWWLRIHAMVGTTRPLDVPVRLWAQALYGAGVLTQALEDDEQAAELFEQSVQLFRQLDDACSVARVLARQGEIVLDGGEVARACEIFNEALTLAQDADDRPMIAWLLHYLGYAAEAQENVSAEAAYYRRALVIRREIGDARGIARSMEALGELAREGGDAAGAEALFAEALALAERTGDRGLESKLLHHLGIVALARGNIPTAVAHLLASLRLAQELGFETGVATGLSGLAEVAVARGQGARAARLLGAADGVRQRRGVPMFANQQPAYERQLASVRSTLAKDALEAALAEGRGLTVEQAIAAALS